MILKTIGHGIGYIGGFSGGVNPLVGILIILGIVVFFFGFAFLLSKIFDRLE